MFMPFTVTQGTMVHFFDCLIDSMARVPSVDDKAVLSLSVVPMLITLSGLSQFLLLIDMGMMLLVFAICPVVSSWCSVSLSLLVIDPIL